MTTVSVLPSEILRSAFPSAEVVLEHGLMSGPSSAGPSAGQCCGQKTSPAVASLEHKLVAYVAENGFWSMSRAGLWVPLGPQQTHAKLLR